MKRHMSMRILAMGLALALLAALCGFAEELGEMDLYDPVIYSGESPTEAGPEGGDADEEAPVETWTEAPEASEPTPPPEQEDPTEPLEDLGLMASASEYALTMGLGEKVSLGSSAKNYQSDNPAVATVAEKNGVVTAVALGTAKITAVRKNGLAVSCVVTVLKAPDSLGFDAAALELGVGQKRKLAAQLPAGTASAKLTYSSSNKKVVTVGSSGELRAKKTGSAVISATAFNGVKVTCKVTVKKAPSKVTLSASKLVLGKGETQTIQAKLPSKSTSPITWKSSNTDVVTVDDNGVVRAVAAGSATVRAKTYNKKKADCKIVVLDGASPSSLTLNADALTLGVGEKFTLSPAVGDGEAAKFTFTTSNKKAATVSKKGVILPKAKGSAVIAVTTHNGIRATVNVTVLKAPSKVGISESKLALEIGKSAQLKAQLPSGTASAIKWESSDTSVATVDTEGYVTGVKSGTASVRARTFNGKTSPLCKVIVDAPGEVGEETPITITPSAERMASNLRSSGALGGKRDAIANVVKLMVSAGFQPAFAAGVGANIYSEGTYGLFESSRYIANYKKRPRYFCYLDGGEYYSGGVLTAVYMSEEEMATYTGTVEARKRFDVENYYMDNYSGKYVQDINLKDLEAFMERLDAGGWEGKFGVGIVQWTGGRTKKLAAMYRKHAGANSDTITAAQVAAAENEMILYDFKGDYKGVYSTWKSENDDALNTVAAARSAGALVCTKYEIPVDKESKAVVRGNKAVEIYRIMMGL